MDSFKWVEDLCEVDEGFIKSYFENSKEGNFLEVDIQCPEKFHNILNDLPFLSERIKIEKAEQFVVNLHDKSE